MMKKTKEHQEQLQNKIFYIIVRLGIILSLLSVAGNITFGFPFETNIKWIFFAVVSFIGIKFCYFDIINRYFKFFYFFCIIIFLIPYGWIDSGGSNNNAIAYIFLIMTSIAFLFQNKERTILIILLIVIHEILLLFEHFCPEIIKTYSESSQFFDRLVQIPLTLIGGFLLLKQFANAYINEKEKLNEYSEKLKEANEKLEYLANRDEMTGLYNRRALEEKLNEIINKNECLEADIWIILYDIDCFKTINDIYGHDIGDKAIIVLANVANNIIPDNSFISRWGGDEFCIIFFGSEEEVKQFMDIFQKTVNQTEFHEKVRVTVSIGVSKMKKGDNISSLFRRVDTALYQSKNNGRNQYTML